MTYDAFFDYGIGAMAWSSDEGRRVLWFLAPGINMDPDISSSRFETAMIYTERSEDDWAVPGNVQRVGRES